MSIYSRIILSSKTLLLDSKLRSFPFELRIKMNTGTDTTKTTETTDTTVYGPTVDKFSAYFEWIILTTCIAMVVSFLFFNSMTWIAAWVALTCLIVPNLRGFAGFTAIQFIICMMNDDRSDLRLELWIISFLSSVCVLLRTKMINVKPEFSNDIRIWKMETVLLTVIPPLVYIGAVYFLFGILNFLKTFELYDIWERVVIDFGLKSMLICGAITFVVVYHDEHYRQLLIALDNEENEKFSKPYLDELLAEPNENCDKKFYILERCYELMKSDKALLFKCYGTLMKIDKNAYVATKYIREHKPFSVREKFGDQWEHGNAKVDFIYPLMFVPLRLVEQIVTT